MHKMAFSYSKILLNRTLTNNCSQKHFVPLICGSSRFSLSAANACQNKLSKAMKAYLKRAKEYDDYVKEQIQDFELGKKHLENIMGRPQGSMTQEDIDEAIEYLLPSGLFVPRARPAMKPPHEILKKEKPVEFDFTGRPYHFLFYTSKPNFSQLLHDGAIQLDNLNSHQNKMLKSRIENPPKPLILVGSDWLSHNELEALLGEHLYAYEYEKFLELFESLVNHPYSQMAESFIMKYRKKLRDQKMKSLPTPTINSDGSLVVTIPRTQRDTAIAKVTVKYPGKGIIKINDQAIDYFINMQCREQVS